MQELKTFLAKHLNGEMPEILITGENGDNRFLKFYESAENLMAEKTGVLRFKHMTGEYPTAASQAVSFACKVLQTNTFPQHSIKKKPAQSSFKTILIYNNYKGLQHSFMLVSNRFEN